MFRVSPATLLVAAMIAFGISASARANVVYDLTFENNAGTVSEGTGTLALNFTMLSQTYNLGYESITPYFVSVSAPNIDGNGPFNITPTNLQDGDIQTGNVGQLYTLSVVQTIPLCDSSGTCDTLILDLYTGSWQIHGQWDSTVDSGVLLISGPSLFSGSSELSTPIPGTLPLFAGGLCLVGCLAKLRRKRKVRPTLAMA
jgi:hypothetical protein